MEEVTGKFSRNPPGIEIGISRPFGAVPEPTAFSRLTRKKED
jgi:hypothetical protein